MYPQLPLAVLMGGGRLRGRYAALPFAGDTLGGGGIAATSAGTAGCAGTSTDADGAGEALTGGCLTGGASAGGASGGASD